MGFPGSIAGDALINVDNIIRGTGTILFVDVTNAATVAPGNSPGTLNVQANYTQSTSGLLDIELAGRNPGEFDVLNVTGIAKLDGTLQVRLLPGFMANAGDAFDILQAGSVVDEFLTSDIPLNAVGEPLFNVLYNQQSVRLIANQDISFVPEPSTLVLAALGMLLICFTYSEKLSACR